MVGDNSDYDLIITKLVSAYSDALQKLKIDDFKVTKILQGIFNLFDFICNFDVC